MWHLVLEIQRIFRRTVTTFYNFSHSQETRQNKKRNKQNTIIIRSINELSGRRLRCWRRCQQLSRMRVKRKETAAEREVVKCTQCTVKNDVVIYYLFILLVKLHIKTNYFDIYTISNLIKCSKRIHFFQCTSSWLIA